MSATSIRTIMDNWIWFIVYFLYNARILRPRSIYYIVPDYRNMSKMDKNNFLVDFFIQLVHTGIPSIPCILKPVNHSDNPTFNITRNKMNIVVYLSLGSEHPTTVKLFIFSEPMHQ